MIRSDPQPTRLPDATSVLLFGGDDDRTFRMSVISGGIFWEELWETAAHAMPCQWTAVMVKRQDEKGYWGVASLESCRPPVSCYIPRR